MNREYKSDVFSMLMMQPEYALDVYNALNGTTYDDPGMIKILQLEKGISLTVRNDASFLIDYHMNLYEHQSTYNPNMPLRSLIYLAYHLENMLGDQNFYGSKRIIIPTVHCVVFYNGLSKRPAREILKLSDSFKHAVEDPDVELKCLVINVNKEFSEEYTSSRVISGYSEFVDKVRTKQKMMDIGNALESSIDECIAENILAEFFTKHRQEVSKVAMLDFTFERQIELEKRDSFLEGRDVGLQEGREEGVNEGTVKTIIQMGMEFGLTEENIIDRISEKLTVSLQEAEELFKEYGTDPRR